MTAGYNGFDLNDGADQLTGLRTYSSFISYCQKVLNRRKEDDNGKFIVVVSDISNFKYINDMYGYEAGNAFLKAFADRISGGKDSKAVALCRDYSDNFISLSYSDDIDLFCKYIDIINKKFISEQREYLKLYNLDIYSGIYVIEKDEVDIQTAIDYASLIKKESKQNSRPGTYVFDQTCKNIRKREVELTTSFNYALDNNEFVVYFQPKVSAMDGRLMGAEALTRWERSTEGLIMPGAYIPIFEKTGQIEKLDYYVFDKVTSFIADVLKEKGTMCPISVNFSRNSMCRSDFVDILKEIANRHNVDYKYLEIEVTESAFLKNQQDLIKVVTRLKDEGFIVSIDDFGTGYSSLCMLTDIPADILKIDRQFIIDCEVKPKKQKVVESIIGLARDVEMKVVCEGVENKEQLSLLKRLKCDMIQGFLFDRPIITDLFRSKWLSRLEAGN